MTNTAVSILNVDTEVAFRKSVVAYLEDSGFTMLEAGDMDEALKVFRERRPDLVLSGLETHHERFELLSTIKKEAPETPVVVVANKDDSLDVIEALREGAWDFIIKPVKNMTVLEHTVCRALERGRLVTENKKYRRELEQKNMQLSQSLMQLKEDQKAGRNLQRQLLPKTSIKFDQYHLSHIVIPSLYLSGDFVDYFKINEHTFIFYIADVSGHGASSAFVTVLLKSLVEQALANFHMGHDDSILYPEKIMSRISTDMLNAKLAKYLTMIYGVIDMNENTMRYSVGGHYPNPIIFDKKKASFIPGNGFAVGIFKDAKFTSYSYTLPEEFVISMFSDGIFEVMQGKDLEDKEQQLLSIVDDVSITMPQILKRLKVNNHVSQPDDITLLMINRTLS